MSNLDTPNISITPNPVRDYLNVEVFHSNESSLQIIINDVLGRAVIKGSMDGLITSIPVANLESGSYLVHIINEKDEVLVIGQFVKE